MTATWRVAVLVGDLGGMHLGDRGCRNRRIEARIKLADRPAERGFDFRAGKRFGEGRHPVLKTRQIVGDLGAHDVGAGGEELAELDPGRAQTLDRAGKPVGAFGAPGSALGQQASNPVTEFRRGRKILGGK